MNLKKIISESMDERTFEIAKEYIMDFIHKHIRNADISGDFDYDYLDSEHIDNEFHTNQEEGLVIMFPSIHIAYDVNINPDVDTQSQIKNIEHKIQQIIDRLNLSEFLKYEVGYSHDDNFRDENLHASRNEWIGINVYTDDEMHMTMQNVPHFLNLLKDFNNEVEALNR